MDFLFLKRKAVNIGVLMQVRPFVCMSKSCRAGFRGISMLNPEKPPH